jgi:hypothetical protein
MPADAKGFAWRGVWSGLGKPALSITSEGVTRLISEKPPINPGKKYVINVTGSGEVTAYAIAFTVGH